MAGPDKQPRVLLDADSPSVPYSTLPFPPCVRMATTAQSTADSSGAEAKDATCWYISCKSHGGVLLKVHVLWGHPVQVGVWTWVRLT